jgi:hypothetical protein
MSNKNFCHKNAVYFILGNKKRYHKNLFENSYINNIYNDLVLETKTAYDLIKKNNSISEINKSLDRKRLLTKKFKDLTSITWVL